MYIYRYTLASESNGILTILNYYIMEWNEIIINYYKDSMEFNQIIFITDGVIDFVEPFELKHHSKYLNLDITIFEQI